MSADQTTSVTYNAVALRVLREHELAKNAAADGTGVVQDASAISRPPTILDKINALVARNHRGEITLDEYQVELNQLMQSHNEALQLGENEIKPQLFAGPAAITHSSQTTHENLHCAHVLPLLSALNAELPVQTTRTQEFNDDTRTIKRIEVHEYADGRSVTHVHNTTA